MSKKKKIRVEFRKNRSHPPRPRDWTRGLQGEDTEQDAIDHQERVRARGELSRKRTIVQAESDQADADAAPTLMPAIDPSQCYLGRVLRVHGLYSVVEREDGTLYRCTVRRLLRSLVTDERNIVTTGDRVWFRPAMPDATASAAPAAVGSPAATATPAPSPTMAGDDPDADDDQTTLAMRDLPEGLIERVEPRRGILARESRRREHVLVANVDQLLIVMSLFEPDLKPHLIDRYLAGAMQGGLKPIICLNKADLADPVPFQPLIGAYSQLGIPVVWTSARTGQGIDQLRELLRGQATVLSGQSGVGKSSLLNALQPGLALRVRSVSEVNQKGRHTTTTAQLIRLDFGGWVVDTPGVRKLQLWDVIPEEVEGFFVEFGPFVPLCEFPNCTHIHEVGCAVKRAVRLRQISERRYTSYLGMFQGASQS
jgi:ribosome biogenesis GTPase